jgi:hypothetical protein
MQSLSRRALSHSAVSRWVSTGRLGSHFHQHNIFLFTVPSRPALVSTQPHTRLVTEDSSAAVKREPNEGDHSPAFSAGGWEYLEICLHFPHDFMTWCLIKQRDISLTFSYSFALRFCFTFLQDSFCEVSLSTILHEYPLALYSYIRKGKN